MAPFIVIGLHFGAFDDRVASSRNELSKADVVVGDDGDHDEERMGI